MSNVRNDREFRFFGMKRSGHHAIIIWLGSHFPSRSVHFINDVIPFRDPFRFHSNTEPTTSRCDCFVHRPEQQIISEREVVKKCLMYNYEERNLAALADRPLVPRRLKTVGASSMKLNLLVLRDPFNLAASRFKCRFPGHHAMIARTLDLWSCYAKEFLGATNFLEPKIVVSFNDWFIDKGYRMNLAEQMKVPFTDAGLNRVAGNGSGSSWSGVKFDGRAQEMPVLDRWRDTAKNPTFRSLFHGRDDIRRLSEEIFGHIPDTEILFDSQRDPNKRFRRGVRRVSRPLIDSV